MRRIAIASFLTASLFGISACGLVLGIPSDDDVVKVPSLDGAVGVDGSDSGPGVDAGKDAEVADTGPDGTAPDAGCSADLNVDKKNCGRCGRSCYGEACTAGKCAPHVIATGGKPEYLRVLNGYVYWTDFANDTVKRIKTDGTGYVIVATSSNGISGPWGVVDDGTSVYIASAYGGKVHKCPFAGCSGAAAEVDGTASRPGLIEIKGAKLYYLDVFGNKVYSNGTSGGARTPLATTDTGYYQGLLAGFAIDATYAYWTEPYNSSDAIRRVPLAGGSSQAVLTNGPDSMTSLRVDGAALWFVSRDTSGADNSGSIAWKNADGSGNVTTVVGGLNNPAGFHLDATHVYWADEGSLGATANPTDGRVLRCTRTSCALPEVLATNQKRPYALDSDGTDIFWIEYDGGNVYRLAK